MRSFEDSVTTRPMKVSVILPAYNEESTIEEAIKRVEEVLRKVGLDYEIIVVDDGSTDRTRSKALYCADNNRIKVIGYSKNLGKGVAIKTGFANSTGDIVAFIDSDLEIDPRGLQMYLKALKSADVAIGSKWHPKSKVEIPLMRKFLSRSFYALAKLLVGINVSDTQAGLKSFRRKALEKMMKIQLAKRYAFDVELLALASLLRLKIVELPVNMRLGARFSIREVWRMLWELLGITYRLRIKKWYQSFLTAIVH